MDIYMKFKYETNKIKESRFGLLEILLTVIILLIFLNPICLYNITFSIIKITELKLKQELCSIYKGGKACNSKGINIYK